MTAAASSKPHNFFGARFRNNLKQHKKLAIINIVMELLGLPVLAVLLIISMYYENEDVHSSNFERILDTASGIMIVSVIAIMISIFLGIVIALFHFSYLYRKSLVDMDHSLPLNATQKFFADYLSGLAMYIVPVFGAIILSFAILGIGSLITDMSLAWDEVVPVVFKSGWIVVVSMIQIYTISIFAISFCGSTFEAIFSIISFMAMIPATVASIYGSVVSSNSFGISFNGLFINYLFISTSPIGHLSPFISSLENALTAAAYTKWIIITILVTLIYLTAAYFLIRFRKAESVSKPYVYKAYFYAMMAMAVFCTISLLGSSGFFALPAIILCGIGWFIMEVITRRGFKKFWTVPIGFVITLVFTFGIIKIGKVTDGFGASKHLPSAVSVSSMKMTVRDYVTDLKIKDKDVIKAALKINKEMIDRHYNEENYTYDEIDEKDMDSIINNDIMVSFSYSTYSGATYLRDYCIPSYMLEDLMIKTMLTDEYAEAQTKKMASTPVYNDSKSYEFTFIDKFQHRNTQTLSYNELVKLKDAYYNDLSDMTDEELREFDSYCFIESNYVGDLFFVLESFENTKKVLDESKIEIKTEFDPAYFQDTGVYISDSFILASNYSYTIDIKNDRYFEFELDERYVAVDKIFNMNPCFYSHIVFENSKYYFMTDEKVKRLINVSSPIVIDERPAAAINIGGYVYFVSDTPENRELLSEIVY